MYAVNELNRVPSGKFYELLVYVNHVWKPVDRATNYSSVWPEKGIFALWTEENRRTLYREPEDDEPKKVICEAYCKLGENLFFKIGPKWYLWNTDKDICDYSEVTQLGDFLVFIGKDAKGGWIIYADEIFLSKKIKKQIVYVPIGTSANFQSYEFLPSANSDEELQTLPLSSSGQYVYDNQNGKDYFYNVLKIRRGKLTLYLTIIKKIVTKSVNKVKVEMPFYTVLCERKSIADVKDFYHFVENFRSIWSAMKGEKAVQLSLQGVWEGFVKGEDYLIETNFGMDAVPGNTPERYLVNVKVNLTRVYNELPGAYKIWLIGNNGKGFEQVTTPTGKRRNFILPEVAEKVTYSRRDSQVRLELVVGKDDGYYTLCITGEASRTGTKYSVN